MYVRGYLVILVIIFTFMILGFVDSTQNKSLSEADSVQTISKTKTVNTKEKGMTDKVIKSNEEWKELLSPEEYSILREKGTERPFTGKFWNYDESGLYSCAACGQFLFESDTKFESGCGWPSFYDVKKSGNVSIQDDYSHGMHRKEVVCSKCGGHLGHVFEDGPPPTGLRYCINSASLKFEKKK